MLGWSLSPRTVIVRSPFSSMNVNARRCGRGDDRPPPGRLGAQLRVGTPPELVVAEQRVERAPAVQLRELYGRHCPAAAGLLPGLVGRHDLPGLWNSLDPRRTRSTRRGRPRRRSSTGSLTFERGRAVSEDDGSRGDVPPFERFYVEHRDGVFAVPRAARGPRPRRGRLPGDVPPRAQALRSARARREPARVGVHDRRPGRRRRLRKRRPTAAARAAGRGLPAGLRRARAPRRRAAAEGTRGRRAALRLRPRVPRHRARARLERGGGAPGRRPPVSAGSDERS